MFMDIVANFCLISQVMLLNGRPDFLEMSENERMGLGLCRACRAISQYEEKCKIDPATVASFLGAANVKREPGNYDDQEGNGGHYGGGGGDDGPWPGGEGVGEQDIRQYMQVINLVLLN